MKPVVAPVDCEESPGIPLSFAQERLWLDAQRDADGTAYNNTTTIRFKGPLDVRALETALNELIRRHEALRTGFRVLGERLVQVPLPFEPRVLGPIAVPDEGPHGQEGQLRSLIDAKTLEQMDLQAGDVMRTALWKLDDQDHALQIVVHHIAADGWSTQIFMKELSTLYNATHAGSVPVLATLPLRYSDYAMSQRQPDSLGVDAEAEGLKYWRQRLDGAPAALDLITDFSRSSSRARAGGLEAACLPPALVSDVVAMSQANRTSLFATLLASLGVLLTRYTDQQTILIGTPVLGRNAPELKSIIGCFINMVVMRLDLGGTPSGHEVLDRVKTTVLGALAHQDVPFERVVRELRPARSTDQQPLYQVMFAFTNTPASPPSFEGVSAEYLPNDAFTAHLDLAFSAKSRPQRLDLFCQYDTTLFRKETVARLMRHWTRVLEEMVRDQEQPVGAVDLLSREERQQIVTDWNATAVAYPVDTCVHELFEEQVRKTPDATALVFGDAALSYAELDRRANQLAHHLRRLGVKPDARVAICTGRGLEMVVGLLAVLKAGGAYVPLDPAYPVERLRFMVDDSAPVALLTERHLEVLVKEIGGSLPFVDLRDPVGRWRQEPDSPPGRAGTGLTAAHLAYVIYTSGSTGTPKGVAIAHANASNFICWGRAFFTIDILRSTLFSTSLNFDLAVFECLVPLAAGATVRIVPNALDLLVRQVDVTLVNTVPSVMQTLVDARAVPRTVRSVTLAGEPLKRALVERIFATSEVDKVFNLYAPSETTTYSTCAAIERGDHVATHIGQPIANTSIYLLDRRQQPVPVGVVGELYIGGAGVARGYLKRPALTAERFVADPFSGEPGARMYRTGDLGRWRSDGNIDFVGRNDFQVKIRGFRIELGDIEAALLQKTGVREAVVVTREDTAGDKRLVAYYSGSTGQDEQGSPLGGEPPDAGVLRAHLAARLPEYMVPAAFVRLEKLPLTVNGKLDRKALPEPDADAYPTHGYDPPVGETETMVAAIWAESLQVQRVGRHDNFFALGGHSLLAVRLIERMRRAGLPTTVRALFATSTLAEFAAEIGSPTEPVEAPPNRIPVGSAVITPAMLPLVDLTEAEIARIVRGVPGGAANVRDIYPLAPLQAGILFHHVMGGEGDPYLLATDVSFESRPLLDAYLEALQQVIARHDILRTAVMWEGLSEPVQVVCGDAALPVEVVELDAGAGDVADQLHARFDPRRYRIDVSRAPMMRAYIARDTAREQWRLLLLSHHLVTDHSSLEVIAREIDAHLLGQADRLPPPLPFRNLVAQARFGVRQDEHIAYFQRLLGDVTEPTAPFGLLDVQGDGTRLADARVRLDEALARRLRTCARALRVSVASLCHLAWAQVLGCVSGREDVVFGTVLFGRMQGGVGADRVMGLFINTLPVRIHVGGQGVAESVRRTHAQLTDLLRHEHAPLALAQRCSAVPAPAPLFSAILNYRHGTAASPEQEDARPRVGMRDRSGQERTNYPVTLNVDDLGEALGLVAQAEASIGPRRVCALMTTALTSLVDALETAPARAVRTLRVLPPDEWEQVVVRWNATAAPYAADRCVHELFEAQAARTPDAVAVMCGSEAVSYDTLNARANQLAWCLRAHGVGPEVRVGLCLERGPALIVALLGVWKAGGAYVPIDPAYPAERVAYMFTDAGVRVLLTLETLRETLPVMPGVEVLALDAQAAEIAAWPTHAVRTEATAQNLAYVIYTSGSTGRPKGVAMHHYGVCNYIEWGSQAYGAGEGNGSPVFTSMAVDLTITNLLPLFVGRPVHLLREDNAVEALADALSGRSGFGPIKITPTHLSLVTPLLTLETAQAAAHTLVIGADFLAAETTLFWQDHAPGVRLMNEYGPTETVVGCSAYTLPRGVHRHGPVPVGGPIQNLRFYVLDTRGEPAPIGVAGELYIGGVGVARGYLGRPGLSAEKFVPDPFAEPGARMYRTGDRARWLEDGNLLILGRTDHQVKVRGYRVELGEIEAALRRHEAVSECLVAVREDQPGDKRLVAYVVSAATASDLRAHLRRALPEYMVPSAFVTLDALPDTTTGKFDRRSLPAPDYSTDGRQDVAPRTAVEELLCGIWQRVLRVEQVGIDDNFFDRGGHSLLAMQVIAQVREVFGVDVPLRRVFDFPTIAGFAEPFDTARQSGACVAASPLPRITQRDGLPASHEQQQLWVIDQLEPGGAAYNIPVGLRLRGALEADALERALREVTDRHAVLRTRFRTQDGRPVQTIEPAWRGQLTRVDLQHLDATAREAEVRRLATEDALRPFDLSRGPLLRTQLLRLGDREHVLLATMHHIVTDAWSMGILIRELGTLYAAFLRGEPSPLPEPDVQYADYSEWQREWSRGAAAEHELRYWERRLAGVPALELPTDRRRPAIQTFRGGRCVATVPRAVRQQLQAVGRRESVTPFMLLLAAFKALLHRYTGVTDLAIGTQVAGRNRPELGSVVGMFLNTLVLRTDLSGTPTVREVLQRVRQVTLEAYANQNVPFERVLEAVRPPRDVSFNPLFQVMLIYQRGSASDVSFPGLTVEPIESVNKTSKLDLTAYVHDGDELSIAFEYNTDLFDETTIVRYLGHWMRVLEEMARDAEQPVGALEILSREERQQVVEDWNRTTVSAAPERCVHELFEAQAARTPAAVAVIDDQGERTYEQMEARAAAIAEVLRARDLGPGDVVAVCMERSAAAVAALLGVMKCGAAYVPLEPSLPFERMATILSTVTAPCVITGRSQLARLAALRDAVPSLTAAVCIDDDDDGAGGAGTLVEWRGAAPARGGARRALPDDLAYVIFTSGSTGVPKGVAVTHRAVGNVIDWVNRTWAIGPTDRVLCVSSFGFDLSVYDLFGPLAAGGSVRIVATAATRDPEALWRLLRREPITVWDSTPAALQQLTPWFTAGAGADAALRLVLLSGDWIPVALPDQVRQAYPRVEVVALGGATEATIWSNVYRVGAVDPGWPSIPYGTPIPRARYYVLTPTLTPCPIGVRGGLYIGGAVLAQGYLGNARQTAAQFVPDPFAAAPGARLYQTGDCARWRADGQLEFLGRVDDQVKIRGYRVELGEIEAVLRERCGIRETVVVVREDAPGQQRLVAYVLGQDAPSGSDLRTRLREWLPDYMIPAAVVPMEIFPLTPNGKVDRKALPAPSGERAAASAYVPPRTPVEQLLSAIWQRVLRVDRVGVEDNFFELGGDSILGIQIASAVREAGLRINVQQIFRDQTIASIAEHVPESTSSVDDVAEGAVPLTPIQAWFFALELPEPWHFNQSVLLRVPEHVSADAVSAALDVLVRHHDALRLRFTRHEDGRWTQAYARAAARPAVLDRIDLRDHGAAARLASFEREAQRMHAGLDLEAGPLFRAGWFDLEAGEQRLLLVAHHLVIDGVSWRIVVEDLQRLCARHAAGQALELPYRGTSYGRWAAALSGHARSETLARELAYWARLAGRVPRMLPRDIEGTDDTVASAGTVHVQLTAEETERLVREVPKAYRTHIQEVLVAALVRTVARWVGHAGVLLELEGHGREDVFEGIDLSRTVGWFTTIYPVYVQPPGHGIGDDLIAVKDQLRGVPGRGLGYGVLRYLEGESRQALARMPRAELGFNYLGQIDQVIRDGQWQAAGEPKGRGRSALQRRLHLIAVNGHISAGSLHLIWEYSTAAHHTQTIEHLAERCLHELRALIAHCCSTAGNYTPSDFPLARLDVDELAELMGDIEGSR